MNGPLSKYQRMSRGEVEGATLDVGDRSVHRVNHPHDLPCYLLTYHYSIEIVNIPAEDLDRDYIVGCLNHSLSQALLDREKNKSGMIISEGLDIPLRLDLIREHLKHLNLLPFNVSRVKQGARKTHVSGIITHGGTHNGKSKVLVRMKEGSSGLLNVKWRDGYKTSGMMKLISGDIYSDVVLLSEEEVQVMVDAGYGEYDLYHQLAMSSQTAQDKESPEHHPKKKLKIPFLTWAS